LPEFYLTTINASSTKEYPAESGTIELTEFLFIDGSPENRRYCIVQTKKPYTLYDGDCANVAIRKPLLGD